MTPRRRGETYSWWLAYHERGMRDTAVTGAGLLGGIACLAAGALKDAPAPFPYSAHIFSAVVIAASSLACCRQFHDRATGVIHRLIQDQGVNCADILSPKAWTKIASAGRPARWTWAIASSATFYGAMMMLSGIWIGAFAKLGAVSSEGAFSLSAVVQWTLLILAVGFGASLGPLARLLRRYWD